MEDYSDDRVQSATGQVLLHDVPRLNTTRDDMTHDKTSLRNMSHTLDIHRFSTSMYPKHHNLIKYHVLLCPRPMSIL